jgi:putative colanic acid biosynthesis UDP-glucose lipid carrier transferase
MKGKGDQPSSGSTQDKAQHKDSYSASSAGKTSQGTIYTSVFAPGCTSRNVETSAVYQESRDSNPKSALGRGILRVHGQDFVRLQKLLDPIFAGGLFWIVCSLSGSPATANGLILPAEIIVMVFTTFFLNHSKVYLSYRQRSLWTLLRRITEGWLNVVASLLLTAFLAKVSASFSRADFTTWALLGWLLLATVHVGSQKGLRFLRSHGGNSRTVLFWGTSESAIAFHKELLGLPYLGLRLAAWFSPDQSVHSTSHPQGMPACSGGAQELERWLKTNDVDQIHFSCTSEQDESIEKLITIFGNTCKPVYYMPKWTHPAMRFNVDQLGSKFLIGVWGSEHSLVELKIKRAIDIIISLIAVVILSPLLLLLVCLVKLSSPGPAIFCQDRYGLDGHPFNIYKFRTMTVTESGNAVGLQQARRNDPRVTPIGRIMRQWSLDELPQLFNVLNGSMSLVGPRPHAVAHNEEYREQITGYMQRHLFRPGITGLAQVQGFRGETPDLGSMINRVEADLHYLKEWSIALDLRIMIKTLLKLRSRNAY